MSNEKKNIIIAMANIDFAEGLKKHIERKEFKVSEIVVVLEHLHETLVDFKEQGVTIEGLILSSDIGKKNDDNRLELLSEILLKIRGDFDGLNIVLLANEPSGHPFIAEVVQMGIYNIFVKGKDKFSIDLLEEVLENPKTFAFVSDYLSVNTAHRWRRNVSSLNSNSIVDKGSKENKEKPNEKQEKIIIKEEKIVNKQVIKRNYQVSIQKSVEKVVGVPIEKKLILVGSPLARSGSTFVSHLLASAFTSMGVETTYIENPFQKGYTYDRFIGHQKEPKYKSKFFKFSQELKTEGDSVFDWKIDNLNLVVKNPIDEPIYDEEAITFETFVKLILTSTAPVNIVDVGADWNKEVIKELYDIAHRVYMVIEPDLSNIQYFEASEDPIPAFYRDVIEEDKVGIIGNRFDNAILKDELMKNLYKDELDAVIPSFNSLDVFKSQLEGVQLIENKQLKPLIVKSLQPVLDDILPKEFLKKKSKETKWYKGLFGNSVSIETE